MSALASLGSDLTAVVIGASGGIGAALVAELDRDPAVSRVLAAARRPLVELPPKAEAVMIDITDEASIEAAAEHCRVAHGLDLVVVATGILHDLPHWRPEKRWTELDAANLERAFAVNTIGPALVAKHFLPLLGGDRRTVFAALSARVGSIGDNRLGGWYAYRASKAALNMIIRTLSIELERSHPSAVCIGLHPGTVATPLSAPFSARVAPERLFSRERAAEQLLRVVGEVSGDQSGHVLAWDGSRVDP